jgi:uncharacterized protein (TIGR02466 family)
MTIDAKLLQDSYALLQSGDPQGAEKLLSTQWNAENDPSAPARNLLGLIRRAQGRFADSERMIRSAIAKVPHEPEYHNSLGITLRAVGLHRDAMAAFRDALTCEPRYWQAKMNLARTLVDLDRAEDGDRLAREILEDNSRNAGAWVVVAAAQRRLQNWTAARDAARSATLLNPDAVEAFDHLAVALAKLGDWAGAQEAFGKLLARPAAKTDALISFGRTLAEAGRLDEAQQRFEAALGADPQSMSAHSALAELRWMRGDKQGFASRALQALQAQPQNVALRLKIADFLNRADRQQDALTLLENAPPNAAAKPAFDTAMAVLCWQLGQGARAVQLAESAVAMAPAVEDFRKAALSAHVIAGDAKKAVEHARWGRAKSPDDQEWIALEATALRKAGDAGYRRLYDYERFVCAYDLPPPRGFSSMADFNIALAEALRKLHIYAAHPLDQSLRGGTQTPVSLLDSHDPIIRAFFAALDQPIRAHMARIGADKGHPLTERNSGAYRFRGCWSVRLTQGGSHVNHVHPEGWLSSAYYVTTPPDVEDVNAKTGWLTFGEPRFREANLEPEYYVQPKVGRLALFPSYMWHGVRPFTAGAERMTIAFDIVPA